MGYCAKGDGYAAFKEGVDKERVIEALDVLDTDIAFDLDDNGISFWESDTHWHEEDTREFLDTLIPYITEGTASYSGEEDCIWRYKYVLEDEEWIEENATIDYGFESYKDEDLINELENRGYDITQIKKKDVI